MPKRGKMSKEDREKAILRDVLEEEELLLDDSVDYGNGVKPIKKKVEQPKSEPKPQQKKKIIKKKTVKKTKTKKKSIDNIKDDAIAGLLSEQNERSDIRKKKLSEKILNLNSVNKKKRSSRDEDIISELFKNNDNNSLPRPKDEPEPDTPVDRDFLRIGRSSDNVHKKELQQAFDNYPKVHRHRMIKSIIITIFLAVLFVGFITHTELFDMDKVYNPKDEFPTILINETQLYEEKFNRTIYENISFEYLNSLSMGEEVSVIGFLKYKLVEVPDIQIFKHVYSIVDDFGDEVILQKVSDRQKDFFIKDGVTEGLFNVTGILGESNLNFEIKVSQIVKSERPKSIIVETATKERIVQKEVFVS